MAEPQKVYVGEGYPIAAHDLSQAGELARLARQRIYHFLIGGSPKPKGMFLETNGGSERQHVAQGVLTTMTEGLSFLGHVEHPAAGLSDDAFGNSLIFFQGTEALVAPKMSRDVVLGGEGSGEKAFRIQGYKDDESKRAFYGIKRKPSAYMYFNRDPVDYNADHTVPVVTTYVMNALGKGPNRIPNTLSVEIMPQDYRYFRRGHRTVEKSVLHGASKAVAREALIEAAAPPEKVERVLDAVHERFAYVAFQGNAVRLELQATERDNRVLITLTLPEHISSVNGPSDEPPDSYTSVLTGEGTQFQAMIDWPVQKAGSFQSYLITMNESLKRTAHSHLEKGNGKRK